MTAFRPLPAAFSPSRTCRPIKRLHRTLLLSLPLPFVAAFGTLMFLLLMQFLIQYLPELVGRGLPIGALVELVGYNLAYMVTLAVPMAWLIAQLAAFGRLSESRGYLVARSAGISLVRLAWPVFVVGALLTAGMMVFNNELLPEANYRMNGLWRDIRVARPGFALTAGTFYTGVDGYAIRADSIPQDGSGTLLGVTVYETRSEGGGDAVLTARRARLQSQYGGQRLTMLLEDGELHHRDGSGQNRYERLAFGRYRMALDLSSLSGFERRDAGGGRTDRSMRTSDMLAVLDSLGQASDTRRDTLAAVLVRGGRSPGDDVAGAAPLFTAPAAVPDGRTFGAEAPAARLPAAEAPAAQPDSTRAAPPRALLAGLDPTERAAVLALAADRARTARSAAEIAASGDTWDTQADRPLPGRDLQKELDRARLPRVRARRRAARAVRLARRRRARGLASPCSSSCSTGSRSCRARSWPTARCCRRGSACGPRTPSSASSGRTSSPARPSTPPCPTPSAPSPAASRSATDAPVPSGRGPDASGRDPDASGRRFRAPSGRDPEPSGRCPGLPRWHPGVPGGAPGTSGHMSERAGGTIGPAPAPASCSSSSPRRSATSKTSRCARCACSARRPSSRARTRARRACCSRHYGITTPRTSFHVHNEHGKAAHLVARMLAGETVALCSDAGTPGISDPGFLLVRAAVEAGVRVEALPGPTAFVPALVASGLPCDRFVYEGFLPHKKGRQTRLKAIAAEPRTVVLYESPHRLVRLLGELAEHCGPERQASVARELTKTFEENRRGTLAELAAHYGAQEKVRGEIAVVIAGSDEKPARERASREKAPRERAERRRAE